MAVICDAHIFIGAKNSGSIPIGTATVSPAQYLPGYISHPAFTHAIATVRSARNATPSIFPVAELTPEGISTATLLQFCSFIHAIISAYLPLISRLNPTPKHGIYYNSIFFCRDFSDNTDPEIPGNLFLYPALFTQRIFPSRKKDTGIPSLFCQKPCYGKAVSSVIAAAAYDQRPGCVYAVHMHHLYSFQCSPFHKHEGRDSCHFDRKTVCLASSVFHSEDISYMITGPFYLVPSNRTGKILFPYPKRYPAANCGV